MKVVYRVDASIPLALLIGKPAAFQYRNHTILSEAVPFDPLAPSHRLLVLANMPRPPSLFGRFD